MQPTDSALLTLIAEPHARQVVAAKNELPSGAIPVLLAVKMSSWGHPSSIYRAKIAAQTLVRSYLAQLVKAQLVERSSNGRSRHLRVTLKGLGVIGQYERELRAGRQRFAQV